MIVRALFGNPRVGLTSPIAHAQQHHRSLAVLETNVTDNSTCGRHE